MSRVNGPPGRGAPRDPGGPRSDGGGRTAGLCSPAGECRGSGEESGDTLSGRRADLKAFLTVDSSVTRLAYITCQHHMSASAQRTRPSPTDTYPYRHVRLDLAQ